MKKPCRVPILGIIFWLNVGVPSDDVRDYRKHNPRACRATTGQREHEDREKLNTGSSMSRYTDKETIKRHISVKTYPMGDRFHRILAEGLQQLVHRRLGKACIRSRL